MTGVNYIALAVPFFFILIAIELFVARRRRVRVYRLGDAINDLSCGVTQQVVVLFTSVFLLSIYDGVYQHRIVSWSPRLGVVPWLIAFVGVDFLYYWWHRLSHEVNLLWAAHVVHHQSEDYNLAVALRQAVLTSWTGVPFYLPLALLGVPPLVYAAMLSLSTLYQFWIHTQLVHRLPRVLELVLNTPAHHRVHHAINPQYLDKNYGAILIVWDRLFRTFADENEAPVYGITKPLASYNPAWAQVHYFVEMASMIWRAPRWRDKVQVFWRGPEWAPRGLEKPAPTAVRPETTIKYDPVPRAPAAVIVVVFGVLVALAFSLMLLHTKLPSLVLVGGALTVLVGVQVMGLVVEGGAGKPPDVS